MSEKDWCVCGASVRTLTGDVVKIINVTLDDGVYCEGYSNYCRTELTPLNNGLNGYRWGVIYIVNGSKPDLPDDVEVATCQYRTQPVGKTNWLMSTNFKITDERFVPADRKSSNPTVKDSLTDDWYDYTNQKALNKCPVGSEVIYEGTKYFVVAHHYKREDIVIAAEFETSGNLKYISWRRAKPADLNKERASFMEEIIGKNFDGYVMTRDTARSLYDYGLRLIEYK